MTRKVSGKFATDNFRNDSIELSQEEEVLGVDGEYYYDIYRELAEIVGIHNVKKIWNRYRGLTVQFPQRLYSREYTRAFINDNKDSMTTKEMATRLSLTDRRVRQIIKELRREEE